MARVRSLICVNSGSSVAERSRAVLNGSITRNVRRGGRRGAVSDAEADACARRVPTLLDRPRPTYDTSACASILREIRNAVFVRTLQPNVLADRDGSRLPALLRW